MPPSCGELQLWVYQYESVCMLRDDPSELMCQSACQVAVLLQAVAGCVGCVWAEPRLARRPGLARDS